MLFNILTFVLMQTPPLYFFQLLNIPVTDKQGYYAYNAKAAINKYML